MAKQYYSHFSVDACGLLSQVSASLETSPSSILRRAVEYWLVNPHRTAAPSARGKRGQELKRVGTFLPDSVKNLLKAAAIEQDTSVSRLLETAFLQWFDEIGGTLIYRLSQPPAKPAPGKKPQPKPVPAINEEDVRILRLQLEHFQRTGNQLRVAQLRRELLSMGVAA